MSVSGEECIMRVFFVYHLNPEPIVYECWCFDICHDSHSDKYEAEKEKQKEALRELFRGHRHVRTALYALVLAVGVVGKFF